MSSEKKGQDARLKFYSGAAAMRHIKSIGIPKRTGEFRAMVAAGSDVKLDTKEGAELVETLRLVVFARHPQQINITDDTNGQIIASIPV